MDNWIVQIKGDPKSDHWEISVVHKDNNHGQRSWGWFDDKKILISHNGGPCRWPMGEGLGDVMIKLAERYADYKNNKITFDDFTQPLSGS